MNIIYLFILILSISIISCSDDSDKELTLQKAPYYGSELKIDGFFYHQREETDRYHIIFFYSNGVLLYGYDQKEDNLSNVEDLIKNGIYHDASDTHHLWGIFEINNDNLIFERWTPSPWPSNPQPAKYYCKIINDTTFKIYSSEMSYEGNPDVENDTYKFRKFDNKPDSTNNFIR